MNVKESVFKMKDIIKLFEDLPLIAKIILCIPVLDIVWSVYKIIRSLDKKDVLGIVLGVLTIFPGAFFIWIVDLVTVILNGNVWWLD